MALFSRYPFSGETVQKKWSDDETKVHLIQIQVTLHELHSVLNANSPPKPKIQICQPLLGHSTATLFVDPNSTTLKKLLEQKTLYYFTVIQHAEFKRMKSFHLISFFSLLWLRVTNALQESGEAAANTNWLQAWWGNEKMTDQDRGLQDLAHTAQTEQLDLTQGITH